MKQPELKITIQNPCSENWDAMHLQTTGRYCETCSTLVVDFTKMSDEELIQFLKVLLISRKG